MAAHLKRGPMVNHRAGRRRPHVARGSAIHRHLLYRGGHFTLCRKIKKCIKPPVIFRDAARNQLAITLKSDIICRFGEYRR